MKKILCITLMLVLLFCGCTSVEPNTNGKTTVPSDESSHTSADAFVPRGDYGELAVFVGGYNDEIIVDESISVRYGLMTLEGRIVAEAIYNRYEIFELDGKKYYSMMISENEMGSPEEFRCTSLFLPSDGSWAITLDGDINHITPERIITSKYDEYFKIYDYSGKLIHEADKTLSVTWNNGTSSHAKLVGAYNWYEDGTPLLIFDMDGEVVFDEFTFFTGFENGKSVVRVTETNLYGIITDSGEWLLEPVYSDIDTVNDEFFVAVRDNTEVEVYDGEMNFLYSLVTYDYEHEYRYYEIVENRLLYYCGHIDAVDDYYRDMFTDEIVTCRENGMPATQYLGFNRFYTIDENGTAWVFDVDGNLLLNVNDVNRVGISDDGNCLIVCKDGDVSTETYYRSDNSEKLGGVSFRQNEMKSLNFIDYSRNLAIASDLKEIEFPFFDGTYALVNCQTGEILLEGCEDIVTGEYGGKQFVTAIYKDVIKVYDENLDLVLRTENLL